MPPVGEVLILSVATASVSFSVSETKLFAPLRAWTRARFPWMGELLGCGYCLGHWVAFALVAVYRPTLLEVWLPLDLFLTALVVAWIAAVQWAALCALLVVAGK